MVAVGNAINGFSSTSSPPLVLREKKLGSGVESPAFRSGERREKRRKREKKAKLRAVLAIPLPLSPLRIGQRRQRRGGRRVGVGGWVGGWASNQGVGKKKDGVGRRW